MLETLSQLHPISGLLHVGAGYGGAVDAYRRLDARRVTLVEADEQRAERLRESVVDLDGYAVLHALAAGEDGEATFFVASNRNESGLVDPRGLTGIWRNLEVLESEARPACAVATLLACEPAAFAPGELNWLVVECLPALEILRGADAWLDGLDVVVARAVADVSLAPGIGCDRPALDAFMAERGFRVAGVEPERHPAVCSVAYLRDWKSCYRAEHGARSAEHAESLAALARERDDLAAVARQKTEELAAARRAAGEQAELVARRNEEIAALRRELDQNVVQSAGSAESLTALAKERDDLAAVARQKTEELAAAVRAAEAQAGLVARRNEEMAALRRELDDYVVQSAGSAESLAALARERDDLAAVARQKTEELAAAAREREEQAELMARRDGEMAALREQLGDHAARSAGHAESLAALIRERDDLAAEARQKSEALAAAAREREALAPRTAGLERKVQELTQALGAAQEQIKRLQKEGADAGTQAEQASAQLRAEQSGVADLRKALAAREAEKAELAARAAGQDEKMKTLTQALGAANEQVGRLEKELAARQKAENKPIPTESSKPVRFGSDANIDDFIEDISQFFHGRFITYVDIGAYIGEVFLKLKASKKINIREAHLFEPNPESYDKLCSMLEEQGLGDARTYKYAIGSDANKVHFNSLNSMTKAIQLGKNEIGSNKTFESECKSLDSISDIFTDRKIDFLKIDVEGYEKYVLKGCKGFLEDQRVDVIYIELGFDKNGTQQAYFADIDKMLQGFGYRVFKIYEQKNEWLSDTPFLRRCNFAYMSDMFGRSNPYKATKRIMELEKEINRLKTSGGDLQKDE